MFRKAIVLFALLGLLIGPNPCCCTLHHVGEKVASALTGTLPNEVSAPLSCCEAKKRCCQSKAATTQELAGVHRSARPGKPLCCSTLSDNNCRCSRNTHVAFAGSVPKPQVDNATNSQPGFDFAYEVIPPIEESTCLLEYGDLSSPIELNSFSIRFCRWNC